MRLFLERLRRAVPLRIGSFVLLICAFALVLEWGPSEADFLVYPAALVAVGLVVGCVVVTTLGSLTLRRAVRKFEAGLPERLETTQPAATGFRIPSLRAWLLLDVSLWWVEPDCVQVSLEPVDGMLAEVVTPSARGRHTQVVRRFTVEDVFGLTRLSFDLAWSTSLRVTPVSAHQSAELAAGSAQGDTLANPAGKASGDMVEMRAYAPGDSMRHVLWKVYARTRRLLVRMPERALAPGPVSVAFFVAGPQDEASAGAARLYVEAGLLGADLLFAADGASAPARTAAEALEQLVDSSTQRNNGATLDAVASQMDPSRLTSCLVFAPAVDGPWRARLVEFLRRRALSATVVIGVDEELQAPAPQSRLKTFLFQPTSTSSLDGLSSLRASLEADGFPVKVIHRATGYVW